MILKLPNFNPKQGQATLLAVLIITAIAVVTAVGVATRQQTGVRKTAYTSQTDQAFSCANSAVDIALGCIRNEEESGGGGNPLDCSATDVDLNDNDGTAVCNYNYQVNELKSETINLTKLTKDTVQQFNVTGSSEINIDFSKFGPDVEGVGLEVTVANKDGSNYSMNKYLWYCGDTSALSGVSGFDQKNDTGGGFCEGIPLSISSVGESIIRIRPYFSDASVVVSGLPTGAGDPSQGFIVRAQGRAGTVQRNIEVMRMNPQLPALFDYVLYSEEGAITK